MAAPTSPGLVPQEATYQSLVTFLERIVHPQNTSDGVLLPRAECFRSSL